MIRNPYGHRANCTWKDEGPTDITLAGPDLSGWRFTMSEVGQAGFCRAEQPIVPGDPQWATTSRWPDDLALAAEARAKKGFWVCERCGGFISRSVATRAHEEKV